MAEESDPTLDPKQANFRRRAAMWAMLMQAAIVMGLFLRDQDLPPRVADLAGIVEWGNVIALVAAVAGKSVEQVIAAVAAARAPK